MEVIDEFESYGFKIWEMDDGTFQMIQEDGSPTVSKNKESLIIASYILWTKKKIKELKWTNRWLMISTCFFATWSLGIKLGLW